MRWQRTKYVFDQFHPWFAWHPVTIRIEHSGNVVTTERVWLETVARRRENSDRPWVYAPYSVLVIAPMGLNEHEHAKAASTHS